MKSASLTFNHILHSAGSRSFPRPCRLIRGVENNLRRGRLSKSDSVKSGDLVPTGQHRSLLPPSPAFSRCRMRSAVLHQAQVSSRLSVDPAPLTHLFFKTPRGILLLAPPLDSPSTRTPSRAGPRSQAHERAFSRTQTRQQHSKVPTKVLATLTSTAISKHTANVHPHAAARSALVPLRPFNPWPGTDRKLQTMMH